MEIRRIKQRIVSLERQAERIDEGVEEEEATDVPGVTLVRFPDDNRIGLQFEAKPDREVRTLLKVRGFRWSPRLGAWLRHFNTAGENACQWVLSELKPR